GAGIIHSTMPSWPTTRTSSPGSNGTSALAFHSDPSRRTVPRSPSQRTTVAARPSKASMPTWGARSSRRVVARSRRGKPVGRPTSTSSRAAEIVRATTMKGGASRTPGYDPSGREQLDFLVGEQQRAVAATGVVGEAGEVVVEQAADFGQAAAAPGPRPAAG